MALYLITEWENNHYDDSDFFAGIYDDETKKCKAVMIGTTRFAGGIQYPENQPLTDEIVDESISWLNKSVTSDILSIHENKMEHTCYQDLFMKCEMRVNSKHRNVMFEWDSCSKCLSNPGEWINPHNPKDIRICFGCNGFGIVKTKRRVKGLDGKQCWRICEPDEIGIVYKWSKNWGCVYDKQTRYNTSCLVEFPAEKIMNVPLEKLNLILPDLTDKEVRDKMKARMRGYPFHQYLGASAWESRNYIAEYQDKRKKIEDNKRLQENQEADDNLFTLLDSLVENPNDIDKLQRVESLVKRYRLRIPKPISDKIYGEK